MKPFRKRRRGGVVATFEAGEAQLLANLAGQVIELLRDRNGPDESTADPLAVQLGLVAGPAEPPDDPVLMRLLPDAYRDDAEDASDFRRLTERSLTTVKVENAGAIIASLESGGLGDDEQVEVELDPAAVQAWLKALTDIRLSLATRLGIETEEDVELVGHSDDEAVVAMGEVYEWLGYVQESLVQSLS